MGLTPTQDPYVFIEELRGDNYVRYRQVDPLSGEIVRRWIQLGVCPCNGTCMKGVAEDDPAWKPHDQRLDVPNTPEVQCDPCTLGKNPRLTFKELRV